MQFRPSFIIGIEPHRWLVYTSTSTGKISPYSLTNPCLRQHNPISISRCHNIFERAPCFVFHFSGHFLSQRNHYRDGLGLWHEVVQL